MRQSSDATLIISISESSRTELFNSIKNKEVDIQYAFSAENLERYCLGAIHRGDYAYKQISSILKREYKEWIKTQITNKVCSGCKVLLKRNINEKIAGKVVEVKDVFADSFTITPEERFEKLGVIAITCSINAIETILTFKDKQGTLIKIGDRVSIDKYNSSETYPGMVIGFTENNLVVKVRGRVKKYVAPNIVEILSLDAVQEIELTEKECNLLYNLCGSRLISNIISDETLKVVKQAYRKLSKLKRKFTKRGINGV